jgi:ketosteroid isomerase-like protein
LYLPVVTRDDLQRWLDRYVDAWRTYDAEAIGDLFSEDATFAYHPYDDPLRGRAAIVESWLSEQDEPGSWEAWYAPALVEGDRVTVKGETRYTSGRTFSNLWELAFDDTGRCREYVEWFMEHPR